LCFLKLGASGISIATAATSQFNTVTDSAAGIAEVARITGGSMGSAWLMSKAAGKCKYLIGVDGKAGELIIRDSIGHIVVGGAEVIEALISAAEKTGIGVAETFRAVVLGLLVAG